MPSIRIAGRPAAPACQHFSTGSAAVTHGLLRGILLPVITGAGAGVGCGTAAYYYGPGSPKTPAAAALTTAGDAACESFGGISPNALSVPAWTSHIDVCAADEQSARTGVQLTPAWAQQLAGRQGVLEVLNPETLRTRSHPLLSEDHMVGHTLLHPCCCVHRNRGTANWQADPGSILPCSFQHWCGMTWCKACRVTSSRSTSSSIQ